MTQSATHYVYILRCSDGSYYCGYTTDIARRLAEHNGERPGGARYTRGRTPVAVVYTESCATQSEAKVREVAIKKLSRSQKTQLIATSSVVA